MPSVVQHVRIPEPLYSRFKDVCEEVQQPCTEVIRRSLQYVLDHPEVWLMLFTQAVEDTSSPQQRQAAERLLASLESVDLDALLAQEHRPLPY